MRRDKEEAVAPVKYHDVNGQELNSGDSIAITYPDGNEEIHQLSAQHGEPPVIRKGEGYLPLPYLLAKKSLKIVKL